MVTTNIALAKANSKCYTTASIIHSHRRKLNITISVLPKGRSFTANSVTKVAVLLGMNRFGLPVAVYDGCGIVTFVYWLRLKQYL